MNTTLISPPLYYTESESNIARETWKASCGPHSLAAATCKTLGQIRELLDGFKGWMNPTHMGLALGLAGQRYKLTKGLKTPDLCNGINRIQWEGPWLNPGVPARVAYFQTHWVAHFDGWVLCTASEPAAWHLVENWRQLLADAGEKWHVTHHYQFDFPHVS